MGRSGDAALLFERAMPRRKARGKRKRMRMRGRRFCGGSVSGAILVQELDVCCEKIASERKKAQGMTSEL